MSSNPTTDTSPGTEIPAAARAKGAGAVYNAIVQRMSQLIVGELTPEETYDRLASDVAEADAARKAE